VTVINGKAVINTSGPMIAAYYAINWCLRPVIARWFGVPEVKPQTVTATLTTAIGTPNVSDGAELELLYRLYVSKTADGYEAEPITFPPKTAPRSKGFPNGQFISVAGKGNYPKGSEIEVQLLYPIEFIY
jgi:molybdopterin molybdotransferase/putative molybdopterin biosynthesis protein